jgi:electron transfer flavoprotein beta subunit
MLFLRNKRYKEEKMNIIVCIKQVPNTANVQIDRETGRLKRDGLESIINPFDEYAIEEGVRIRERCGGKVTVITMGPLQAEAVLREAIAKGVNEGVLISDKAFSGADTLATSYVLSTAIRFLGNFDIVICGKQALDGDTAQVGPGVAEMLDIPHVAYVKKIKSVDDKTIRIERMMEDGYDLIESSLPILLTVVKEINNPRVASLKGKIAAKKAVIKILDAAAIGVDIKKTGFNGSPTQVMKIFVPSQKMSGEKFTGEPNKIAAALVKRLSDLSLI